MGHKDSRLTAVRMLTNDFMSLTASQIQYICHQTNLVDKEVRRRHEQFLKMTQNGRMTKEQFVGIVQNIWPTGNVQRLANYLFHLHGKDKQRLMDFTTFIILHYQLNNDKSYLGFLFDMLDTRYKGYLSREKIEPLFASLFELIGLPTEGQSSANISQRQITDLIEAVDASKNKKLSRSQFLNMRTTGWTDARDGVGILLTEHSC